MKRLKELIQLGLKGAVGLVEQEKNQVAEAQAALSCKIGRFSPMGSNKVRAIKQTGYFLYNL